MRGRKTGGRKPGSRNKSTIFRQQLAAEGYQAALSDGVMPLQVVMQVMRGGPQASDISQRQYEAAVAALPYCHPRLTASFVSASYSPGGLSHEERLARLDQLERDPLEIEGQAVVVEGGE